MTRLYFMCSKSDVSNIIDTDNPQNDVHLVLSIDPYTYSSTDPNQNEKMGYLWRSIELGSPKGEAIVLVDLAPNFTQKQEGRGMDRRNDRRDGERRGGFRRNKKQ